MSFDFDVIVIGGGIVGLAHAWMASRRGLHVQLIERSPVAQGASVRNFGMVWPVGQPAGELVDIALTSRAFWLELCEAGVVEVEQCGSIHAAHRADELAVLQEFCDQGQHAVSMLTADEVLRRAPLINPEGLLGGMFSQSEVRANPRVASQQIARWLSTEQDVSCCFGAVATQVDNHVVHTADGRRWSAERIIVCGGSDLQSLFPEVLQNSGLRLCKLQMLKAHQRNLPPNVPHIASGLTLRHYTSFNACPSLAALRERVASETPELDRYGIHVMASTFNSGELLLGDSHEYDGDIDPFDKRDIDELMIRELKKIIRLEDWTMHERWHGIYAKHSQLPVVEQEVQPGVHVFTGTGGSGMTMSFGLADRAWRRWLNA